MQLEVCEGCGGESEPPCLDEDTNRTKPRMQPCKRGLRRTTLDVGDDRMRVLGQDSFCTSETLPGQCGYAGQETCDGECKGRSTASEDGQMCVECGGPGQGTCDGVNQDACDAGLEVFEDGTLAPICVCPDSGCPGCDTVEDQSGPSTSGQAESCGQEGQPRCVDNDYYPEYDEDYDEDDDTSGEITDQSGPAGAGPEESVDGRDCGVQLLADEDGTCLGCGVNPGDVPCPEFPQCGRGLVFVGDFCEACGGELQPVCCDEKTCSDEDPNDRACADGLVRRGTFLNQELAITTQTSEAYCATSGVDNASNCGQTNQPPCDEEEAEDPNTRKCLGLTTVSTDGTECVRCGGDLQVPCEERFQMCTSDLLTIFDVVLDPVVCLKVRQEVASQSGGDCGLDGMPPCDGFRCLQQTILASSIDGAVCIECGTAGRVRCPSGAPCSGVLRWNTNTNKCDECGDEGQAVCGVCCIWISLQRGSGACWWAVCWWQCGQCQCG